MSDPEKPAALVENMILLRKEDFEELLNHAAERGAERMLLEVEWANEPALALYRGLGFVVISHRVNYYGTNRDALVMQRELVRGEAIA